MDQGRGLLVVDQVRHQQVIGAGGAQDRVHIGAGHVRQVGKQACTGLPEVEHLGRRMLHGALVTLDIEHLRRGGMAPAGLVRQDALLVDGAHRGHGGAAQGAQVEPLCGAQVARDDVFGILVVRDRLGGGVAPLRHQLLLGLVDREVELRVQRLILPGPPLPVVVGELGAPRHQQDQQKECDTERDEYADERVPVHRAAI